jgi:hypothetical protein
MNCKFCKVYSGKRNVCSECKSSVPYVASKPKTEPFNRKKLLKGRLK